VSDVLTSKVVSLREHAEGLLHNASYFRAIGKESRARQLENAAQALIECDIDNRVASPETSESLVWNTQLCQRCHLIHLNVDDTKAGCIQMLRAEMLRLRRIELATPMERGWLIEMGGTGAPIYWCPIPDWRSDCGGWESNAAIAVRFTRQEDAERVLAFMIAKPLLTNAVRGLCRVTEHEWVPSVKAAAPLCEGCTPFQHPNGPIDHEPGCTVMVVTATTGPEQEKTSESKPA
jgi:hypothetical protein